MYVMESCTAWGPKRKKWYGHGAGLGIEYRGGRPGGLFQF
jgi:hypothetical protein